MRIVLKPMGIVTLVLVVMILSVCVVWMTGHKNNVKPVESTVSKSHLVAQWGFDEGSGKTVGDSVAGGHSGTLQGSADWTNGLVGAHALILPPGKGNFVDIPQPVVDISKSFTVTACVKLHRLGGFQTIVSIDGDKVSGFFLQLRDTTSTFGFVFLPADDPAKNTPTVASMKDLPEVDKWYHLAGVYDATAHTISLYVNGVLAQTTPLPASWRADGHTIIGRGRFGGDPVDFTEGQIDDVRFYDTALPTTEVKALADSDLPAGQ